MVGKIWYNCMVDVIDVVVCNLGLDELIFFYFVLNGEDRYDLFCKVVDVLEFVFV